VKAAHIVKIERRLRIATETLLPERVARGEVKAPDSRLRRVLTRLDSADYDGRGRPESGWRQAVEDITTLLETDVPELIDAVRQAQGAQRRYCRWCGERRLGLLTECRDEPRTWECRDEDGCDYRQKQKLRDQPALPEEPLP
jgi:hypothetical protein